MPPVTRSRRGGSGSALVGSVFAGQVRVVRGLDDRVLPWPGAVPLETAERVLGFTAR